MIAALDTLRELPCRGRRVAVLGDMAELGEHAVAAHREVGRYSAQIGVARLVAVGQFAHETAQAARQGGLEDVTVCEEVASAAEVVKALVEPGDLVLLKASRATALERVGEALREVQPAQNS
jgi:UDP-N-acetylmuramoyl-tripeptide--D-alanyl-D-alanine ligase